VLSLLYFSLSSEAGVSFYEAIVTKDFLLVLRLCLTLQIFFIVGSCVLSAFYKSESCFSSGRQQQQQQSTVYFGFDQLPTTKSYSDILVSDRHFFPA
jgi:hypothetical protein